MVACMLVVGQAWEGALEMFNLKILKIWTLRHLWNTYINIQTYIYTMQIFTYLPSVGLAPIIITQVDING